jgi:predicted  nucleic acid-binding Zn-ribbon protein
VDPITTSLVDFGALGVFAAFLAYQFFQSQKRMDELTQRFQDQLKEINKDHDERGARERDRYEDIIRSKDDEIRNQIENLNNSMAELKHQTEKLVDEQRRIAWSLNSDNTVPPPND